MKSSPASSKQCQICHLTKTKNELIAASLVRPSILAEIKESGIAWSEEGFICNQDLNRFRTQHIQSILETEKGELTKLENEVLESIQKQETISTNVELEFQKQITFGERLSDKIATCSLTNGNYSSKSRRFKLISSMSSPSLRGSREKVTVGDGGNFL